MSEREKERARETYGERVRESEEERERIDRRWEMAAWWWSLSADVAPPHLWAYLGSSTTPLSRIF